MKKEEVCVYDKERNLYIYIYIVYIQTERERKTYFTLSKMSDKLFILDMFIQDVSIFEICRD